MPLAERPAHVELVSKVALFTARVHHRQLAASPSLAPLVAELHSRVSAQLQAARSVVGYNLAVLRHVGAELASEGDARLFEEALAAQAEARAKAKQPGAAGLGGGRAGSAGKKGAKNKKQKRRHAIMAPN